MHDRAQTREGLGGGKTTWRKHVRISLREDEFPTFNILLAGWKRLLCPRTPLTLSGPVQER